jgi:hypothetical protein
MSTTTTADFEKDKIAVDILVREINTVDVVMETHAGIMTALDAALLYVVYGLKPGPETVALSVLGLIFSGEMFLHTYRLADIANTRLEDSLGRIGIDASRKPTKLLGLQVPLGSTLLLGISVVFIVVWVIVIV